MKILLKYIGVLFITLSVFSCEEESNFAEPDIELVAIYSITAIDGADAPFKINIYKEQNLIIEYASPTNVLNFESTNYMDISNSDTYEISVNKVAESASINYLISADRITGEGTLIIDGTTTYNMLISEENVYN